jgi:hypothetical protein
LISVCTAGGMGVAAILEGVGTPKPAELGNDMKGAT